MCFGGDDAPSAPVIPPPPPPQEMMDVIDEITGTQSVVNTLPNGSRVRKNQALPRSKEEEARYVQAGQIMDQAIGAMRQLYQTAPAKAVDHAPFVQVLNNLNDERVRDLQELSQIPDFSRYVDDFKAMQNTLMEESFSRESRMLEDKLAQTGHSASDVGRAERNALLTGQRKSTQEAGIRSIDFATQLRNQDLLQRGQEYNLREQGRQGQLSALAQDYAWQQQHAQDLNQIQDRASAGQQNLLNVGSQIQANDLNKRMASQAPQLALSEFQARNNNALNYYNAEANTIKSNYEMKLAEHQAQPPSFGDSLLSLGTSLGSAYLMGPAAGMSFGSMFKKPAAKGLNIAPYRHTSRLSG